MLFSRVFFPFRQVFRGCGTLPYVGEHPGWIFVITIAIMSTIPGLKEGSIIKALAVSLGATICVAIPFCIGAYGRAMHSDRRLRRDAAKKALDLWYNTQPNRPDGTARFEFSWSKKRHPRIEICTKKAIDIPEGLRTRIEHILSEPFEGAPRTRPNDATLAPILVSARDLSAHEKIAARATS